MSFELVILIIAATKNPKRWVNSVPIGRYRNCRKHAFRITNPLNFDTWPPRFARIAFNKNAVYHAIAKRGCIPAERAGQEVGGGHGGGCGGWVRG